MTFEPFHCTFVGDSRGFSVTPEEGTLSRRGGDPQELDVSYKGNVSRLHCMNGSQHVRGWKISLYVLFPGFTLSIPGCCWYTLELSKNRREVYPARSWYSCQSKVFL